MKLSEIIEKVKSSQGCLVFVATVRTEEGKEDSKLDFEYLRSGFSVDDIEQSFSEMKKFLIDDVRKSKQSLMGIENRIRDAKIGKGLDNNN